MSLVLAVAFGERSVPSPATASTRSSSSALTPSSRGQLSRSTSLDASWSGSALVDRRNAPNWLRAELVIGFLRRLDECSRSCSESVQAASHDEIATTSMPNPRSALSSGAGGAPWSNLPDRDTPRAIDRRSR